MEMLRSWQKPYLSVRTVTSALHVNFFLTVFADKDIQSIHPLLFPCGNLARDTVSCELERVGLKVTRIVCYNTLRHPGIDESLKTLSQYKVSLGCIIIHHI